MKVKNEEEYARAKQVFEADPNNTNLNALNAAKENLEAFYDEKLDEKTTITKQLNHNLSMQ